MKTNSNSSTDDQDVIVKSEIENIRILKDQRMGNPSTSPLLSEKIQSFTGLKYFEIDLKYRSVGIIRLSKPETFVELTMSNGAKLKFQEYGTVTFNIQGKDFTLTIFKNQNLPEFSENPDQLFIPFKDATSSGETNVNGRYLPLNISSNETEVIIDFNKAINPYRAYNEAFVSVNPPLSQLLEISMISGERKYEDR